MWQRAGGRRRLCSEEASRNLLLVARLSEGGGEPLKTLVQTITRRGTGRLDVLLEERD